MEYMHLWKDGACVVCGIKMNEVKNRFCDLDPSTPMARVGDRELPVVALEFIRATAHESEWLLFGVMCPACRSTKDKGHKEDCPAAQLMADVDKALQEVNHG